MERALELELAAKLPLIRRIARSFVRRRGLIEEDDAEQIAALETWRALQNPPPGDDIDAWIWQRCWWRLIDEIRSGRPTGIGRTGRGRGDAPPLSLNVPDFEEGDDLLELLPDAATPYDDLDDGLASAETVRSALAVLPPREHRVVYLRYFEDLTLAEIGQLEGISESRVSQIVTSAQYRMRAALARLISTV